MLMQMSIECTPSSMQELANRMLELELSQNNTLTVLGDGGCIGRITGDYVDMPRDLADRLQALKQATTCANIAIATSIR